ncbi:hypothetical protein ABIC12_002757 [Pantoea agglomerans]|jgi:hypothetical protein|uniref:hypothetical protein n=1 Tax=Enterobacter agglomerans TaxID=549 RepID=UPI0013BB8B22|nr:hypothetical protein [Pantoea agglomerans]MDQ0430974.1 hypothetical protein [Pantoea agglomerans]NEG84934.1 hypothetical protein [Pantoea agglomerans]NEH06707.1 hypothetical protein [Pantoea agglomerans]
MSNLVVIDGDALKFETNFGANIVTPTAPCLILGSGEAEITNKKICVLGDESKVSIAATYIKSTHPTPGTGKIEIIALATDQQATFVMTRTAVIVVGSQFTTLFTPSSPAKDPQGKPDPNVEPTKGTGTFINSQSFVTAG